MASSKVQELKEDYLEVDPPIPGQNYVCLSFVSPEDMIRKKALYETRKYFQHVLNQVKNGQVSLEGSLSQCSMESFLDYCVAHEEENSKAFNEENDFRTSLRGLKVRGVYESMKEAQRRAKVLQTRDPTFHVFVGQVGYWLPWDPNPDNIENQEYSEQTLNEIVKKYKENKQAKDLVWEQETRKRIELAKAQTDINTPASSNPTAPSSSNVADASDESSKDPTKAIFEGEDVFLARKTEQQ
jgi:hypothetical protein